MDVNEFRTEILEEIHLESDLSRVELHRSTQNSCPAVRYFLPS